MISIKDESIKVCFGVTSGKFLGFIVRHRGIEIDQSKIDAIMKIPESRNIHELKICKEDWHIFVASYPTWLGDANLLAD